MDAKNIAMRLVLAFSVMSVLAGYAGASIAGGEWTLSGTVYNGGTCQPLANVTLFSPTYSAATNVSTSSGAYLLRLGRGSQIVNATMAGYNNFTYSTPYEPVGSIIEYNIMMLKPGEKPAANCSFSSSSTPGTSNFTTTTVMPSATSSPASTSAATTAPVAPSKSSSTGYLAIVAIIIIVIIIVVAYFAFKKR
jgi:hypothetical protein